MMVVVRTESLGGSKESQGQQPSQDTQRISLVRQHVSDCGERLHASMSYSTVSLTVAAGIRSKCHNQLEYNTHLVPCFQRSTPRASMVYFALHLMFTPHRGV